MPAKTQKQFFFMAWMLFVLLAFPCSVRAASEVKFLGSFSQKSWTEEHQYIYQIDLWREGERLFGFYSFYAGLQGGPISGTNSWRIAGDLKGKSVLLKNELIYFSFSGSLTESGLSGRWSGSMSDGINLTLNKLPSTKIEPALLKASLGSYEAWVQWAEQYLDGKDSDNKQLSQELASCAKGDGQACLAAGNHSKIRGNQERAHQLYKTGCNLNNPWSCRFIGRAQRAREIFQSRCTGKATMENNFACRDLGKLEEDSGNLTAAKEWYRKGCNDAIPMVCPDFKRLDGIKASN